MRLFCFFALLLVTIVEALNCSIYDSGNFQTSCSFNGRIGPRFTVGAVCLNSDLVNVTSKLDLSLCIGLNMRDATLEWRVPSDSCNTTAADAQQGLKSTQNYLVKIDDYCTMFASEDWNASANSVVMYLRCQQDNAKPVDWSWDPNINLSEHIFNRDGLLGCFGKVGEKY